MNELDRALRLYRIDHPEKNLVDVSLTEILFFLIGKVEQLQEKLKSPGRKKSRIKARKSEEAIQHAFDWAGMKGLRKADPSPESQEKQQ